MSKYGFARWPFEISSGSATSVRWAARPALRLELERQVASLRPDRPTALVNIWAAYGAGKTYAMRYLQLVANKEGRSSIYCVAPGVASGFSAYYRSILASLDPFVFQVLTEDLKDQGGSVHQSLFRAARFITIGNMVQASEAHAYLSGAKVSQKKRNELSVSVDLSEIGNAATALRVILDCLGRRFGVLLLLDEMQDLSEMKDRALGETIRSFQKIFDEVQQGLKIVTSFTAFSKGTVSQLLGPALTSRSSRTIEIPEFDKAEALEFLRDLVIQAKVESNRDLTPFTLHSLERCVESVLESGGKLLPRPLILRANTMLEELESI